LSLLNYLVESNHKVYKEDLQQLSNNLKNINLARIDRDMYTPIEAKDNSQWTVLNNPERLVKKFKFDNTKECLFFFEEVYNYQNNLNHHCKILVDNLNITIETYTHDLNGITELDKKIKIFCDEIENDINYFKKK